MDKAKKENLRQLEEKINDIWKPEATAAGLHTPAATKNPTLEQKLSDELSQT
ncbi:MAG: hypothetical protein LBL17_03830 [Coxiellaceae bacterium]|jgi:hypothetical protein|nr:hypothetical protein [Coxiellaceae bacterium]